MDRWFKIAESMLVLFDLRYLIINLDDGNKIYTGVATDYAEDYPDAPHYWVLDKNNIIDKNGSTNIEKYSLYFELSK